MISILIFLLSSVSAFNILVYSPSYAVSHTKYLGKLADTLTEAGNNVTILVPINDASKKPSSGAVLTTNVIYIKQDKMMKKNMGKANVSGGIESLWLIENKPEDYADCYQWFVEMMKESCANIMRNQQILHDLKKTKFDVAIAEPMSNCGLGIFEYLGITKTVLATSTTHFEGVVRISGEPLDLSYVPAHGSRLKDKMNFFERLENYRATEIMARNLDLIFEKEEIILKNFLGVEKTTRELMSGASLFFTNSNPYFDYPRPVIQKTVPIGGISVDMDYIRSQKLDEEWNEVLNRRNKSILISFGSMVQSSGMPIAWRDTILANIKHFPDVTFIWKYENDDVKWADSVNNIYFSKWVPQTALLVDDRLSAFLTHGGLGSTNELAHCGKPAIMVPIFGDQMRNSNMLARLNGSIVLNKFDLEKFDIVNNALKSILYDESYLKNARKLAELLNDSPFNPKELVVKHTEFLAKYGPFPSMSPRINHLNYFERKMLDVELYVYLREHYDAIGLSMFFVYWASRVIRGRLE